MLKLHIKYASFGICQKMRKCSLTYPFDINIHTNYRLKIDKDLRGRFFAIQGGGCSEADALQGRQRSIAKIRPQRLFIFGRELVSARI